MSEKLSVEDIRHWLEANLGRGKITNPHAAKGRELPVKALGKAVGIHFVHLHAMRDERRPIGRRAQAALSHFIRDWENGLLEFGTGKQHRRFLIHRATPKPRGIRMAVSWDGGAKLTILPRPALNPRIPQFRDIFAGLAKK